MAFNFCACMHGRLCVVQAAGAEACHAFLALCNYVLRRPHVPRDPDIREIFQIAGIALPGLAKMQVAAHA